MLGSIYVGLSGLQSYSSGLQKVSNNVSNLNSTGFKTTNVTFSNIENSRDSGGATMFDGAGNSGGGVEIGGDTLNLKAGELRASSRDLDLAVDGSGFLVLVKDGAVQYTRTGSFEVNKDGFIVLAGTEWHLGLLDGAGNAQAVSIDANRTNSPVATTRIKFADNLSSTATSFSIPNLAVYAPSGEKQLWTVSFAKEASASDWSVTVKNSAGATVGSGTIAFLNGVPTTATSSLTIADSASGLSVVLDFSGGVTSFSSGSVSTLRSASIDGHGVGALTSVAVNATGEVEIKYSNDQTKSLGAVALATFRDPSALRQESAGLFVADDSAQATLLASSDERVGLVKSRFLEASNVDLSKEFGDLILIQRGYQASSQIISVSNDMIQQLFGIRGQG